MRDTSVIGTATIVALMPDFDAAALVVPELGRLGVARADIFAASLARRELGEFTKQLGVSQLDLRDQGDSINRLLQERIPTSRTRYLSDRLEGKRVLLVLPHVQAGAEVCRALQRAGGDLGPSPSTDDVKDVRVPLRAERLDVVKYLVQSGTVRLRKEIITAVERFEVPLVREELVIERTPLDGTGESETIRIPLRHEDVRVSKSTVVTSEVAIRRHQFEEIRHIEEPVRHEQVIVTKDGDVSMREGSPDRSFPAV